MSSSSNIYPNNQQILTDIQNLQNMEAQLFSSLETNPNMSVTEQRNAIQKINEISNMRINLYKTLSNVNSYAKNNLDTSLHSFEQQVRAIGIVEDELNKARQRLTLLEDEKNNKLRLVEINNYYGDKYHAHSELMKIIIYTLVPIIILNVVYGYGFLPYNIFIAIIIIIAIIGSYYFWTHFSSILMRDNMNYDKYDWNIPPPFKKDDTTNSRVNDPWFTGNLPLLTCIGSDCCNEGMIYDETNDICVIDTRPPGRRQNSRTGTNRREGFNIMDVLTKKQPGKYKADVNLKPPVPA